MKCEMYSPFSHLTCAQMVSWWTSWSPSCTGSNALPSWNQMGQVLQQQVLELSEMYNYIPLLSPKFSADFNLQTLLHIVVKFSRKCFRAFRLSICSWGRKSAKTVYNREEIDHARVFCILTIWQIVNSNDWNKSWKCSSYHTHTLFSPCMQLT